jgi:hypothetical protein
MNFAGESVCLLTDNIRDEVVAIHRSQGMLKMLCFLAPAEEVLVCPLKLFSRNICNFPTIILFQFFRSGVTVVNFAIQTTP